MADSDEEKTEHVSQRRLNAAREEGQVAVGRDAVTVAGLFAAAAALKALAPAFRDSALSLVVLAAGGLDRLTFADLAHGAIPVAAQALGICGAAAFGVAAATTLQTQGGFWPHLALPTFSRMGGGRLTRILKREFWVDLGLAAIKVVAIGGVAYLAAGDALLTLGPLVSAAPEAQLAGVFRPIADVAVKALTVMALLAGVELALSHLRFRSKMKMTKQEAKREMKEDQGDPLIRSRRRKRQRELAKGRAALEVPRADAVVVNPTHVAVAIRYRKDEGAAPRVTAKGKGELAEIIRDLARANGIPIVEDIPLARLLHRRVKVGGQVPAETFRAVAAVLAFVYRITGRVPQRGVAA
jgi:flagellar biosynthetic protein FlhB